MSPPFSLPSYVELRELRQYAKDLLNAAASGEPSVLATFAEISKEPSLTTAQLLVAREYGFSSWAKLKSQVERNAADPANAAIRRARRRRGHVPQNEGAAVVPVERILATSQAFSLAVSAVLVYSQNYVIELNWVTRRTTESAGEWQWLIRSYLINPFAPLFDLDVEPAVVTVDYSDGRSVSNRKDDWTALVRAHPGADPPILSCRGGSGSAGGRDSGAWYSSGCLLLSPLPPPGELRLTFDLPAFGFRDVRTVLDADLIIAAAKRVRRFPGGHR
jgi:hypothetical protein